MKNVTKLLVVAVVFVFSGCSNEATETEVDQNLKTQDEKTSNLRAGNSAGAQVIRYEDTNYFVLFDYERNLIAYIGFDIESFCTDFNFQPEIFSFQNVIREEEDGIPRINQLFKGDDVTVVVYELFPVTPLFCDIINSNDALFKGTGDIVGRDNDLIADLSNNRNTFGFALHGDGITITYHVFYDRESDEFSKGKVRIMLK